MSEQLPMTDDTGTAARARRDEISGLVEAGVSLEAIQAQPNVFDLSEEYLLQLMERDAQGDPSLLPSELSLILQMKNARGEN